MKNSGNIRLRVASAWIYVLYTYTYIVAEFSVISKSSSYAPAIEFRKFACGPRRN